jgi:hypothetical protein
MIISSRTPEGEPNRCPICRHQCRIEPSCLTPDAPCPSCGHLLWFPQEKKTTRKSTSASVLAERPKRAQGQPTARAPEIQAARLIGRLIRRAEKRFGPIRPAFRAELADLKYPRHAERLLSLLSSTASWGELFSMWHAEDVFNVTPPAASSISRPA